MPEIDLEPRRHSSSYELRPESRWWLVLVSVFALVMAWASGFFEARTWAMFVAGALVAASLLLSFPNYFLRRRR